MALTGTSSFESHVLIWDLASGVLRTDVRPRWNSPTNLAWNKASDHLLTAGSSSSGIVQVFDAAGQEVWSADTGLWVCAAVWSPDSTASPCSESASCASRTLRMGS